MGAAQCGFCQAEVAESAEDAIAKRVFTDNAGDGISDVVVVEDKKSPVLRNSTTFCSHDNSVEDLAWVNNGLKHLWPQLDELARFIFDKRILPMLKDRILTNANAKDRVTDLRVTNFTIGKAPFVLGPIQSTPQRGSNVRVRCHMDYRSDMLVQFEMDTKLGTIPFGIQDFRLSGPLVLHLRPFVATAPGTGGVSGGFVDIPKVEFQLSGIGSVAHFPGMLEMVQSACDKVLADMMVLPNLVSQVMSFEDLKMYPLHFHHVVPVGVLQVKLVEIDCGDKHGKHHHHTYTASSSNISASTPESSKKAKSGFMSRMFAFGKTIKHVAEDAVELIDDGLAMLAGRSTASYLRFRIGQADENAELDESGKELEFYLYDHEQHLYISFWDRDFSSADDKMAEAEPLTIDQVLAMNGKPIDLMPLHGRDDESRSVTLQVKYLSVRPTQPDDLKQDKVMVIARIKELRQQGSFNLKGKTLIIRMKCGSEEKTTKPAKYMKGADDNPLAVPILTQIRANLKEQGRSDSDIEKALDLTPLASTRFSVNSSYFFNIPSAQLASESLQITLIEKVQQKEDKKKFDEIPIGSSAIELSKVRDAEGFLLPTPIEIDGGALGKINVQIYLNLNSFQEEAQVQDDFDEDAGA